MIEKNERNASITEEEAELYDRQIRLWGLDSQKRLRQARILLYGISGLGVEVAKNVILAGVKSLTLMDEKNVNENDVETNFTMAEADTGKNRAVVALPNIQKLNPMVQVSVDTSKIEVKGAEFFQQFDVVCVFGCSQEMAISINLICAENDIHFMAGDSYGFYGYAFIDLGTHEFSEEIIHKVKKAQQSNGNSAEPSPKKRKIEFDDETITVKKSMTFHRLKAALEGEDTMKRSPRLFDLIKIIWTFKDNHGHLPVSSMESKKTKSLEKQISNLTKYLEEKPMFNLNSLLSLVNGDFSPSCAIIGGIIGQEVIKAVSQKDAPLNNFFLFDGTEGVGYVQEMGA